MYDYKFHPEAKKELEKLNRTIQLLFTKKLKQILKSPELGKDLGNKNNLQLAGLKKVYFDSKRYRIVYEIIDSELILYIIAIGKRDNLEVYKKANERKKDNKS